MDTFLLELLNRRIAQAWLDIVMLLSTTVGLALAPATALYLLRRAGPRRRLGWTLLLALGLALLATLALQLLVARPRPVGLRTLLAVPLFASFPSGHASLLAAASAVLLGACGRGRRWLWVLAPALTLLVGISRVYVGHHFPSDVLAGWALGAGLGLAIYGWRHGASSGDALEPGLVERWRWLLWPQLALVAIISELAYLRLLPALPLRSADKLLHFFFFGLVTLTLDLWLRRRDLRWGRLSVPAALPWAFLPALAEELLQGLSPARTCELLDLAADLAGMVLFVALGRWLLGAGRGLLGGARTAGGEGQRSKQPCASRP